MGGAYFLQFLDKLVLSQATLFNLREDLVCCLVNPSQHHVLKASEPGTSRISVLVDLCYLLLWIPLLELA